MSEKLYWNDDDGNSFYGTAAELAQDETSGVDKESARSFTSRKKFMDYVLENAALLDEDEYLRVVGDAEACDGLKTLSVSVAKTADAAELADRLFAKKETIVVPLSVDVAIGKKRYNRKVTVLVHPNGDRLDQSASLAWDFFEDRDMSAGDYALLFVTKQDDTDRVLREFLGSGLH